MNQNQPQDTAGPQLAGFAPLVTKTPEPAPVPAWTLSEKRLARERAAKPSDYIGSIWRQDGLAHGVYAHLVGQHMAPDATYNPYSDPEMEASQETIWPEFKHHLYRATSGANREYIKDRLRQKQTDMERLGDLGFKGEAGRLALNFLMPDQLLAGMATGWVSRGAQALKRARAVKVAETPIAAAAAQATLTAENLSRRSSVAAGLGFGAVENAALEKYRQSVNFENDSGQVAQAALFGIAFGAPFAIAGSGAAKRAANAASREAEVLRVIKDLHEGNPVDPAAAKRVAEVHAANKAVVDFEAGRITPDELSARLDEFHGPIEPVEAWSARNAASLREMADTIIAENFPGSTPDALAKAVGRAKRDSALADAQRTSQAEALKAAEEAQASAAKLQELHGVFGTKPAEGSMAASIKEAFAKKRAQADAALKAEEKRASEAGLLLADEAHRAADRKALHADAWTKAEADMQARLDREYAAMVTQRELTRMDAPDAPARPPEAPTVDWKGREVSWQGKDGDTLSGTVLGPSGTPGRLIVDVAGEKKSVRPEDLDQYEAPQGNTVGAAQVAGTTLDSTATQRTALAEWTIPGTDTKVPLRLDFYATLNGSPSMEVRKLTYGLIKDAIGNDAHEAQAWTASERKSALMRTHAGNFKVTAREALREAYDAAQVPLHKRPTFNVSFYDAVSRVVRGDLDARNAVPMAAAQVDKAAAAMRTFYKDMLDEAKRAGVKGADGIDPSDSYVNRKWHQGNIEQAQQKHGKASLVALVASAIKDKAGVIERARRSPTMAALSDSDILTKKAAGFLSTVQSLQYSTALADVHLGAKDMGTLRRELDSMGLRDDQVDDLVDFMFEVKEATSGDADAGRMSSLKYRFGLDETARVDTQAGTLRLADLFENDARVLVDTYASSMAGHTALAHMGITSRSDWAERLRKVDEDAKANGHSGKRVERDKQTLQFVYDQLTGRPHAQDTFNNFNRGAAAFRGYVRSVMLPQLGLTSFWEFGKAVGMMGFSSFMHHIPSFKGFIHGIRDGHLPDAGLARDIRLLTGFGNEMAGSYARAREMDEGLFGEALTAAEHGANKLSHITDVISGNASFTSLTKQLSAMGAAQELALVAHGKKQVRDSKRTRWVSQGLSEDRIDMVMDDLKKHSTHKDGKLESIDHEAWARDNHETLTEFRTFIERQTREAIQDHDLGESIPFLHSALGKVLGELKTFFLVGHAKNFLRNVHFKDMATLQVFAMSFIAEAMAYSIQSAINAPDKLAERLQPDKIVKAVTMRMAMLGTLSMFAESGYQLATGGDSLVFDGATANTGNRSFANTPSLMVLKALGNIPSTGMGALLGTDVTTRKEFKESFGGALPFTRYYGLRAGMDWFANTLPTSDPAHPMAGQ